MHFSQALVALLAVPVANAFPLRAAGAGGSGLAARGDSTAVGPTTSFIARSISPELNSVQTIYARFAHIKDDGQRTQAVVRDLHRRGILDTLVNAIAAVVTELLGTDGASARHYRRQLTSVGKDTGNIVDQVTCLILKLIGINDSSCGASMRRRHHDGKSAKASKQNDDAPFTGLDTSSPEAMRESLAQLLAEVGTALEQSGDATNSTSSAATSAAATSAASAASSKVSSAWASASTLSASASSSAWAGPKAPSATSTAATAGERRSDVLLQDRQISIGVQGLLEVLRELLDTLLNTLLPLSSRDEGTTPTLSEAKATGTGCPAPGTPNDGMYRPGCPGYGRRDLAGDKRDLIQSLIPAIQMLIEQLTAMTGGSEETASSSSPVAAAISQATAAPTGSKTKEHKSSKSSSTAEAAEATSTSESSADDSSASTPGMSASSLLSALLNSRDTSNLLEGDGFHYVKRHAPEDAPAPARRNALDGVNDFLHGTFQRRHEAGAPGPFQRRAIDALINKVAGPSLSRRVFTSMMSRSIDDVVNKANSLVSARADFAPVWEEVKALGNGKFGERSVDDGDDTFHPVWTSFRDMVDNAFAHPEAAKRSPEAVDVKPFAAAAGHWAKVKFAKHNGGHTKRDVEQLKPLGEAAKNFAKSQMQEWTAALKAHAH